MNIRRGLFRLWLIASALWLAFAIGVPAGAADHFPWMVIPVALAVSAAALGLGSAMVWAFGGFRR